MMAELCEFLIWAGIGTMQCVTQFIVPPIVENPILLLMFGISFLGACIGIFGRLLSRN